MKQLALLLERSCGMSVAFGIQFFSFLTFKSELRHKAVP
jgi:hypothetical protein